MTLPGARRHGALLVNLGSPASPRTRDVRNYLREFLGDPWVLDMPAWQRWLLLRLVILPRRPQKASQAYAQIWTPQGSPLIVHGRALRDHVAEELGEGFVVELAMRYGKPTLEQALIRLADAEVDRIAVLPLFPQYASSTTVSIFEELERLAATLGLEAPLRTTESFFEHPAFVEALIHVTGPALDAFRPDHVLFSYHGLPEHQIQALDASGAHCLKTDECCSGVGAPNARCYRAQCFATTRAVARSLSLQQSHHSVAFQSRLGRRPWIRPHTDRVLPELFEAGVRRLAILCPSFVADCLETLEEIGIRGREQWRQLGGEDLLLIPCVNADGVWARGVADLIREQAD